MQEGSEENLQRNGIRGNRLRSFASIQRETEIEEMIWDWEEKEKKRKKRKKEKEEEGEVKEEEEEAFLSYNSEKRTDFMARLYNCPH